MGALLSWRRSRWLPAWTAFGRRSSRDRRPAFQPPRLTPAAGASYSATPSSACAANASLRCLEQELKLSATKYRERDPTTPVTCRTASQPIAAQCLLLGCWPRGRDAGKKSLLCSVLLLFFFVVVHFLVADDVYLVLSIALFYADEQQLVGHKVSVLSRESDLVELHNGMTSQSCEECCVGLAFSQFTFIFNRAFIQRQAQERSSAESMNARSRATHTLLNVSL